MVSKNSKAKEKKAQRKEMLAKLGAAQQVLTKANNPANKHLEPFAPFQKYNRNGLDLSIECKHYSDIDEATFERIYRILEDNMKKEYEACTWGWSEKEKRTEMKEKDPWYLVVRDSTHTVHAFAHFKFDFDEEIEVLYCYEVQVSDEMRGRGLGKFLMQILELIGSRSQMKKIMITVFKHNPRAQHFFYDILKYTDDETSPKIQDPIDESEYCYEILSKELKQKSQPSAVAEILSKPLKQFKQSPAPPVSGS